MEDKKLSQRVKELRKNKGLSQEELAKTAGLSLRTIQRVENKETEPTGDTLKRIAAALDTTPAKLLNWNEDTLKATIKTKNEYLHIFEDKLVISKNPKTNELIEDYGKSYWRSVWNVIKSIKYSFIIVPLFTFLSVNYYHSLGLHPAIYAGSIAFFYLILAIRTLLFSSNSSLINVENITEIRIQKKLLHNELLIFHKESGRVKDRVVLFEKNKEENMKNILLSEKLIDEKEIKLNKKIFSIQVFVPLLTYIVVLIFFVFNKTTNITLYFGLIMLLVSILLIIETIYYFNYSSVNKTKESVSDERV
ncbi:MAG TPA: helix-turn-helix domain-containing protein [Chitinophagales bacterium]|nr:helix-turn-helix domain-containing protein [Chitinophagales bacterium]